jgi:hypothetical protein
VAPQLQQTLEPFVTIWIRLHDMTCHQTYHHRCSNAPSPAVLSPARLAWPVVANTCTLEDKGSHNNQHQPSAHMQLSKQYQHMQNEDWYGPPSNHKVQHLCTWVMHCQTTQLQPSKYSTNDHRELGDKAVWCGATNACKILCCLFLLLFWFVALGCCDAVQLATSKYQAA